MKSHRCLGFTLVALLAACVTRNGAVPALQQTVPPGGVAVCLLSTVQYTCVADNSLVWREFGSPSGVTYSTVSGVNDSGINTGVFTTVLTDISGNTLTSTATIDSVNLTDVGRNISCADSNGLVFKLVQVEDTPQPPGNLDFTVLSSTDSELSVNLTWSPSRCVMVYYVEVTATNINFTNTTTSQHITLTLQIGIEYSFRVRGADTINRLGQWSDPFVYPLMSLPTSALPSPTSPPPNNSGQLSGGAIAGIVIGVIVVLILVILSVGILFVALHFKPQKWESKRGPTVGTTEMVPKRNDTTYADLVHSGKGRGKGGSTGKSGTDDKGVRKHCEDPVNYGEIDHAKTKAQSKQTRSAPGGSLPSTAQPNNPKPAGQNPSSSTKK